MGQSGVIFIHALPLGILAPPRFRHSGLSPTPELNHDGSHSSSVDAPNFELPPHILTPTLGGEKE